MGNLDERARREDPHSDESQWDEARWHMLARLSDRPSEWSAGLEALGAHSLRGLVLRQTPLRRTPAAELGPWGELELDCDAWGARLA